METTQSDNDKQIRGRTTGIILASCLGVLTIFVLWKFKKFPYQE